MLHIPFILGLSPLDMSEKNWSASTVIADAKDHICPDYYHKMA